MGRASVIDLRANTKSVPPIRMQEPDATQQVIAATQEATITEEHSPVAPPGQSPYITFDPMDFGVDMTSLSAATPKWDPLNFADSDEKMYKFRTAELKHARLAMLAAAGWPFAEVWDPAIAQKLGLPNLVDAQNGRRPSILNGGL